MITWNDLSYSLRAQQHAQITRREVSTVARCRQDGLGARFFGLGASTRGERADRPGGTVGCPNFATFVCPALVYAATPAP